MGSGSIVLNVTLADDAVLIDDVVVVGYGVQRKKEVTGSIVQVNAKQITGIQTPSFEAALQGQAAGVQVSQSSGIAGAPSLIRVRGVASVSAAGDPLYVVDGIPITQEYFLRGNSGAMNNNPLAAINPNDIESVEILKDAAATGIYGSRGANGVILITTKRGKQRHIVRIQYPSRNRHRSHPSKYDGHGNLPHNAARGMGKRWRNGLRVVAQHDF